MRLYPKEVDTLPGKAPEQKLDKWILPHSGAVGLDLKNTDPREQAFFVTVAAVDEERDGWLVSRCRIRPFDAVDKEDQFDDSLGQAPEALVRAKTGQDRRLRVTVEPPVDPASRAGIYALAISSKPDYGPPETAKLTVVVRPSPDWDVRFASAEASVAFTRHRALLWLEVVNRGNDWLYLELTPPDNEKIVRYAIDVERVALPPAVSVDKPSTLRVPLRVRSRKWSLWGMPTTSEFALAVKHVDAPSVPPFPTGTNVSSLNLTRAVLESVAKKSSDVKGKAVYKPPIPAKIIQAIGRVRGLKLVGLIIFVMFGLPAMYYGATWAWMHIFQGFDHARTTLSSRPLVPGGLVRIKGPWVGHSDVEVLSEGETIPSTARPSGRDEIDLDIPDPHLPAGQKVVIVVKRHAAAPFPTSWSGLSMELVTTIGAAPAQRHTISFAVDPSPLQIGTQFRITPNGDVGFGPPTGVVRIGTRYLTNLVWSDRLITGVLPTNSELAGAQKPLFIWSADKLSSGTLNIDVKDPKASEIKDSDGVWGPGKPGGPSQTTPDNGGLGTGGLGNGGPGETPQNPAESQDKPEAYVPTDSYKGVLQALDAGSVDDMLLAGDDAEKDDAEDGLALKAYAYAYAKQPTTFLTLKKRIEEKPSPQSPVGRALVKMALAEIERALGHEEEAVRQFKALGTFCGDNHLSLELVDKARARKPTHR